MNARELKVGQFAECNGSIIYKYAPQGSLNYWLAYTVIIEQHPSRSIWESLPIEEVQLILVPQKKHIDNTIKLLKDFFKDKRLDNLTYIENLNILKNYLKSDIIAKED